MPRWYFEHATILAADGLVHRPDCRHAPPSGEGITIEQGEEIARGVAPAPCWTCQPDLTTRIGPSDERNPPRMLD